MKLGNKRWLKREVEMLRDMAAEGHTLEEISKRVGRCKKSTRYKLQQLGVKGVKSMTIEDRKIDAFVMPPRPVCPRYSYMPY